MDVRTLEEWDELFRSRLPRQIKLYFSDGTKVENDRIVQESLFLEEALCSGENLKYGCCEAGCLRIRIVAEPLPPEQYIIDSNGNRIITDNGEFFMDGTDYSQTIDKSFSDLYVRVIMQMDNDRFGTIVTDNGETFVTDQGEQYSYHDIPAARFGYYKVVSDTPTSDKMYRDLICYDKMYDILNTNVASWYNSLEFPITIKDMRDSFFDYLGISQLETELINDDFIVNGHYRADNELYGREIIESICELNGVFGHINRYDEFVYISLPAQDSIEYPYYVNGSSDYEDYITSEITKISLATNSGDESIVVGNEGNTYYMQPNPLTYEKDNDLDLITALDNLLEKISQFTYRPFNVTTYGNPMLQIGTSVTFNTRYKPINSFVMSRTLKGIQALKDTFSAKGLKNYPKDTNSKMNQIDRTKNTTVVKINNSGNLVTAKINDNTDSGNIIEKINNNVKGEIEADAFTFYNTIKAYSEHQITKYEFIEHIADVNSYYLDVHSPYYQGNSPVALKLVGHDSGTYSGYMGVLLGNWLVSGSLRVNGTKPRLVETENYGKKLLYAYEMASPMFGDIGDGQIAEDGKCYVWLDPVFAETITTSSYQVFIQKCGDGDCWVSERKPNYFVVEGTPKLNFSWELKAKQSDFDQRRMESETQYNDSISVDYGKNAMEHINQIYHEREVS